MADTEVPLPEPLLEGVPWELWGQNVVTDCYTADQLRTYGDARAAAAVAAEREAIIAAIPGGDICDPQAICDMVRGRGATAGGAG